MADDILPVAPVATDSGEDSRVAEAVSALTAGNIDQLTARLLDLGVPQTSAGALAKSLVEGAIASKQNDATAAQAAVASALQAHVPTVAVADGAVAATVVPQDGVSPVVSVAQGETGAAAFVQGGVVPAGAAIATSDPSAAQTAAAVQTLIGGVKEPAATYTADEQQRATSHAAALTR